MKERWPTLSWMASVAGIATGVIGVVWFAADLSYRVHNLESQTLANTPECRSFSQQYVVLAMESKYDPAAKMLKAMTEVGCPTRQNKP